MLHTIVTEFFNFKIYTTLLYGLVIFYTWLVHLLFKMSSIPASSTQRGRGQNKHYWTIQHDDALIEALSELSQNAMWWADCGFKNGYLLQLETMMEAKLPGCAIKASPHIESRVKWFKQKYCAITDMSSLSGFRLDNDKIILQCEKNVYDEYVKVGVIKFFSQWFLLGYYLVN